MTWAIPCGPSARKDFLYVHNFHPERWPAGNPETDFGNCDPSPTKEVIKLLGGHFYELSFGKRLPDELYRLTDDPECVRNLANDLAFKEVADELRYKMMTMLKNEGDPRALGQTRNLRHLQIHRRPRQGLRNLAAAARGRPARRAEAQAGSSRQAAPAKGKGQESQSGPSEPRTASFPGSGTSFRRFAWERSPETPRAVRSQEMSLGSHWWLLPLLLGLSAFRAIGATDTPPAPALDLDRRSRLNPLGRFTTTFTRPACRPQSASAAAAGRFLPGEPADQRTASGQCRALRPGASMPT